MEMIGILTKLEFVNYPENVVGKVGLEATPAAHRRQGNITIGSKCDVATLLRRRIV